LAINTYKLMYDLYMMQIHWLKFIDFKKNDFKKNWF